MKKNNMLTGSPIKTIVFFSLPIMLSSLLQYNYSLVDNIIVGRYVSTDALAAVGNVGPIGSFLIGAAFGLTSGFTIPVAHAFGAGDKRKLSHYAGNSITISAIVGVAIIIVAHILTRPLLKAIGTPSEIIDLSAAYMNILYFGVPFQMLSNNFTAISRAVGESKKPLYFFIVSVIVNFVLDLLFVKNFKWGVEGAAWATLIANAVAALLTGIYVIKYNKDVEIKKSDLKPNMATAWEQIKLGIPVSLQFTITSIGSMCLQSAVNSFGANVIAGFTAAGRVENLTNIPMSGLGVATQTFVGQNYGAGNHKRMKQGMWVTLAMTTVYTIITGVLLLTFSHPIIRMFSADEAVIYYGAEAMKYFCPFYWILGILNCLAGTVRGTGKTVPPMIIMLISMCLFRIVWIKLAMPQFDSIDGIFILYPISWTIGAVMMVLYTIFGKWQNPLQKGED